MQIHVKVSNSSAMWTPSPTLGVILRKGAGQTFGQCPVWKSSHISICTKSETYSYVKTVLWVLKSSPLFGNRWKSYRHITIEKVLNWSRINIIKRVIFNKGSTIDGFINVKTITTSRNSINEKEKISAL